MYGYASPTNMIDPFGLASFRVGPTQREIVSQEKLYEVFRSTRVNGVTYFSDFDYACSCVGVGCGKYSPRISLNATITIAVKRGGGPLNDIPLYPWATEDDIYFEELKHATDLRARIGRMEKQATALEQVEFTSETACKNACGSFFRILWGYLMDSQDYVHRNSPHPKW
jgi:hypothetical protein